PKGPYATPRTRSRPPPRAKYFPSACIRKPLRSASGALPWLTGTTISAEDRNLCRRSISNLIQRKAEHVTNRPSVGAAALESRYRRRATLGLQVMRAGTLPILSPDPCFV